MRTTLFFFFFAFLVSRSVHGALPPLEPLTPQNLYRLEKVGLIQRGTVEEMAWSPDGTTIAAAGSAGIRLYTVATGREQLLLGHAGGVNDVDFSPDGTRIVSAGDDGMLRLWNAASGLPLRVFNPYLDCACTRRITSAKFTADGTALWVGGENGPLRVVDAVSGAILAEDARHVLEIMPDADRSRFAVTEQRSANLSVWPSSGTFAPERELDMRFMVWNAAFVPGTSQLLVAGFVGADLTRVDVSTGQTVRTMRGSRVLNVSSAGSIVTQVIDWFGDVRRISLRVTDIDSGAMQFNVALDVELTDARFSPSGDLLAVSDGRGALTVWDWRSNIRLLDLAPRGTALIGLAVLNSGLVASIDSGIAVVQSLTKITVESGDTVRLWDIASGRDVGALHTADYGLVSADTLYWDDRIGRLIIGSTAQPDHQLSLDPATGDVRVVDTYFMAFLADEQYIDESPDGLLRAEATSTDDVRVIENAFSANALTLRAAGPGLRFSSDGKMLMTTGVSGAITLWAVKATVPAPD